MYNFIKILEKVKKILVTIILFIPSCIYYPFYKAHEKYISWKIKKGYSEKYINHLIKYCDNYRKDCEECLFVLEKNFYSEYDNYLTFKDFIEVRPYWVRKKICRVYYSNTNKFQDLIINFYKDSVLTEEELKKEFTNEKGEVSYWYSNLKGKRVVKF